MNWMPLTARMLKADPARTDPYLLLADALGFADHLPQAPGPGHAMPVSIEVVDARLLPRIQGLTVRAAHRGSRFLTGTATMSACSALLSDERVIRVQLAQALRPQRARVQAAPVAATAKSASVNDRGADDGERSGETLFGVVDNGCPFAHQDLQGRHGTRILRLWNQEPSGTMGGLGEVPTGFGYGAELTRAELNALMRSATPTTSTSVDEEACYRAADYSVMLGRQSHGAHSLSLLAGARRWNGRPRDDGVPLQTAGTGTSAEADVVFVQFPQELMDCVSVASLEHRALDAFRYISRVGKEKGYKRVVISFGYESWLGPHDGTSWFEEAVAKLTAKGAKSHPRLQIFMVAGNSKERRAHAELPSTAKQAVLTIHVPPSNEVPTFVEIWAPSSTTSLSVQLTPPHAAPLPPISWDTAVAWPQSDHLAQAAMVMHRTDVPGRRRLALLRIAPTQTFDMRQGVAPHGLWSIRLAVEAGTLSGVHAYIGRAEADAASPRRGRQAHFIGRTAQQQIADRRGTLNGHACGKGVEVAGAQYFAEFPYATSPSGVLREHSTDYSGAGPTNGSKARPDKSVSVEDGIYHFGVLGAGNRSGCVTRLRGTSTASPLAARSTVDPRFGVVRANPSIVMADLGVGSSVIDPFG